MKNLWSFYTGEWKTKTIVVSKAHKRDIRVVSGLYDNTSCRGVFEKIIFHISLVPFRRYNPIPNATRFLYGRWKLLSIGQAQFSCGTQDRLFQTMKIKRHCSRFMLFKDNKSWVKIEDKIWLQTRARNEVNTTKLRLGKSCGEEEPNFILKKV